MRKTEISSSNCPSCGAPLPEGNSNCAYCGAELIPHFDLEHSSDEHLRSLHELVFQHNNIQGFFTALNAYVDQKFGYNLNFDSVKSAEKFNFEKNVLRWSIDNEKKIVKIEEQLEKERIAKVDDPNFETTLANTPLVDTMRKRVEHRRKEVMRWLDLVNNANIYIEHIGKFPYEFRSEVLSALQEFSAAHSDQKMVSDAIESGLMTKADRLVDLLYSPAVVEEFRRIHTEINAASTNEVMDQRTRRNFFKKRF